MEPGAVNKVKGVFKSEGRGTLCLDIGSSSIKFVRAEGGRVTDYGVKEIGEAAEVPMILQQMVKDFRPSQVLTFVSGPAVSIRQAPFPEDGAARIARCHTACGWKSTRRSRLKSRFSTSRSWAR